MHDIVTSRKVAVRSICNVITAGFFFVLLTIVLACTKTPQDRMNSVETICVKAVSQAQQHVNKAKVGYDIASRNTPRFNNILKGIGSISTEHEAYTKCKSILGAIREQTLFSQQQVNETQRQELKKAASVLSEAIEEIDDVIDSIKS